MPRNRRPEHLKGDAKRVAISLKHAFDSWVAILGAIVAGISLFSLGTKFLKVGLSPVLDAIVQSYRGTFHSALDFLAGLWGIVLPPLSHDLAVLWLLVAGSIMRVSLKIYREANRHTSRHSPTKGFARALLYAFFYKGAVQYAPAPIRFFYPTFLRTSSDRPGGIAIVYLILASFIAWPVFLFLYLHYPLAILDDDYQQILLCPADHTFNISRGPDKEGEPGEDVYFFDARIIFLGQLGLSLSAVIFLSATNAITP